MLGISIAFWLKTRMNFGRPLTKQALIHGFTTRPPFTANRSTLATHNTMKNSPSPIQSLTDWLRFPSIINCQTLKSNASCKRFLNQLRHEFSRHHGQ